MASEDISMTALIPGKTVNAIFGYCKIRNFPETIELLQDKVMLFCNQIGEIVHGVVDEYHGVANKNLGESFMLVWRVSGEEGRREKTADMALLAFAKIAIAVERSPALNEYRFHPGLLQRMLMYKVKLGFGLHYGWAIEGAIGSEFKIDASYLGPNVNVAQSLEAATADYSATILLSHDFALAISPEMRRACCRLIDCISIRARKSSFYVYSVDIDTTALPKDMEGPAPGANLDPNNTYAKYKLRQLREQRKAAKLLDTYVVAEQWAADPDLLCVRKMYTEEFFTKFELGFRNYEAGEWEIAASTLRDTVSMLGVEDGASRALLDFMHSRDYQATKAWKGFRALAEAN